MERSLNGRSSEESSWARARRVSKHRLRLQRSTVRDTSHISHRLPCENHQTIAIMPGEGAKKRKNIKAAQEKQAAKKAAKKTEKAEKEYNDFVATMPKITEVTSSGVN